MNLEPSTDYKVDNRYKNTRNASDNDSGRQFLDRFISMRSDAQRPSLTADRKGEGRFLMSGPGDAMYSFKNAYAASRSPIAKKLLAIGQ